jgi:peptidoglycan/xylan/chitin deacetylase (PgdA/CDA1 family)
MRSQAPVQRDTLVLMYHAIPSGGRCAADADPHYSVSLKQFVAHLELMADLGLRPRSVRDLLDAQAPAPGERPVALTFDDGHDSNFAAYAELARRGGRADLFVNPATVGTRGYLSWAQLRELARHGASIQSHGYHHVFLDTLPSREVDRELSESRRAIQEQLGVPAVLFAPPNGRMPRDLAQRARVLGYRAVCSSRVGLWRQADAIEIPRFAVLAGTSPLRLAGWLSRSPWELKRSQARDLALAAGKRVLGAGVYRTLRAALLREARRA